MKKLLILIILLFSSYGYASDWTTQDTLLQGSFLSILGVDFWQTYTLLYAENYRKQGYYETNPILGKYPTKQKFFLYCSSCVLLHTSIAYLLPKPYRTIWQIIWIGVETGYVYHNYQIGVRISL